MRIARAMRTSRHCYSKHALTPSYPYARWRPHSNNGANGLSQLAGILRLVRLVSFEGCQPMLIGRLQTVGAQVAGRVLGE